MPQPQKNDGPQTWSNQSPSTSSSTEDTKNEAVEALKEGLTSGARELSTEVKHVATGLVGDARHVAEDKLREGKNFAGDQLGTVAWALRNTSDALRSKESGITSYVEKAASSIDDVSIYLSTRTLSQLINDAEGFARREPAIFFGGAFFAGLLGGRFLKAAKPAARMSAGTGAGGGTREPVAGNPSKPATPSQPKPNEGGNGQKTSPTPGTGNGNGSTGNGSGAGNGPTEKSSSTDKPDAPRTGKGPGAG
jgi:hypothetical protein